MSHSLFLTSIALLCLCVSCTSAPSHQPAAQQSARVGGPPIALTMGLPATAKESEALYDEMDFQRACQCYLWGLPMVSVAQWQQQASTLFGAGDADLVLYDTYKDKLGILTPNATTPYILGFANLERTGPLVIEYPAGPTAGGINDFWQRPLTDIGLTGPDRGRGAMFLVIGPGQKPASTSGYIVVHSPTFQIFEGTRILDPDPEKAKALLAKIKIYPLSQRARPPLTRLLTPEGRAWSQVQPRGMDYWKVLHASLQIEPVAERDRMIMGMLAPLGIEKGKPFNPDDRQTRILTAAAERGELMAMNLAFNKRFAGARYRSDAHWENIVTMEANQEAENYTTFDQRSAWFYEAIGASKGMTTKVAGEGQAYLGTYHDPDGNWFDGGRNYTLHVPPDAPARQFWSLTIYDAHTRGLIDNREQVGDKSSRTPDLIKNPDGSVDLYIGPAAPQGKEKNWIPTLAGKAWFAYFRLYAPTQPFFDAAWPLPDIVGVK